MNESFVENYIDDLETRNYEKFKCSWSSCGNYLAISAVNQQKASTLLLYDNEYRLIEPQSSSKDYLENKIDLKLSNFEWSPNLPIVCCVWQDEQIGFFRIKHDTKKWLYFDALTDITTKVSKSDSSKLNESDYDENSSDESIESKLSNLANFKILHLNWLNESTTLYYVTSIGQIKFFDFNLNDNKLELVISLQIKDELTHCIEVYFDQHWQIYLSSKNGLVYSFNELNKEVNKIIQPKCSILKMIYFKRKSRFILISDDFVLLHYNIINQNNEQNYIEVSKVKLEIFNKSFNHIEKLVEKRKQKKKGKLTATFKQDDIFILKIDENYGIIGVCVVGERVIRLFQIDSGHNLAVIAIESTDFQWSGVSYLIYSESLQLLLAGTSNHQFIIWKRSVYQSDNTRKYKDNENEANEYSKQFEFTKLAQFLFEGTINCISVNKNEKIAVISNSASICLIEKQTLNFEFLDGLAIIQLNAKDLRLIWLNSSNQDELIVNLGENVKEIYLDPTINKLAIRTNRSNELTVVDLKNHQTYEIVKTLRIIQNFKLILQDKHAWQLNIDLNKTKTLTNNQGLSINCYNLNGQDEQLIYPIDLEKSFKINERIQLSILDTNNEYLLIILQSEQLAQNYCYLVYKLDQNEANQKCRATMILVNDRIINAKINSNGTLIAILDDSQLFLVHVGSDELQPVKMNFTRVDQIYFATNESRLLCIQSGLNLFILICYVRFNKEDTKTEFDAISIDVVRLIIDFLTDKRDLNLMIKQINKLSQNNEQGERNLWLNLARCSVKSRNVEMGLYCMCRLKDVRVIRDVQNELASKSTSEESRNNLALAVLAMNLNLFQEAEELFKQSEHNLKLVQYYQSRNDWSIALKSIEKLNERSVFYNCAKYYENEMGDIENAIKYYEQSGTGGFEVTRMLFDLNELNKLKKYCFEGTIHKSKSTQSEISVDQLRKLKQWYGQYCESIGDFQSSLKAYEEARDQYNQVRLLCSMSNLEDARKIVDQNESDKNLEELSTEEKQIRNAAILHLGKHLESIDPTEAVQYFLKCKAINHAIRTCKINQFDEQLTKIIQNYGSKNEIIELVKKLEENEDNYENLFNLYKKINMIDKCLCLGFRGRLWSQIRLLLNSYLNRLYRNSSDFDEQANDIDVNFKTNKQGMMEKVEISDETTELALSYLKNNSQIIDIIIDILLIRGDHHNLIKDLILEHKIDINNQMIEKIEKISNQIQGESDSKSLFQSLADSCMIQGNYLMAAKIFNQTGDRVNSIKALVRLGDVQKVINYANISRDKNVYKIAASFLQTTQGNEKTIETFCRKAGIKRESGKLFD